MTSPTLPAGNETIERAALRSGALICSVDQPGRHHTIFRELGRMGVNLPIVAEQGFVTSAGRFVNRMEAVAIATEAKQIKIKTRPASELFSEDVW